LAVTEIVVKRRLPYRPEELHGLVADVRRYPGFIRWITSLSVTQEVKDGPRSSLIAHASVGWKALQERFATKVESDEDALTVAVSLVRGPFRVLRNHWRFEDDGAGGAVLRFEIAYEFSNPVLNAVARANRERMADKIMGAFEAEAGRRFKAQR
jgi:coenzyme Q-binding protein COQ10